MVDTYLANIFVLDVGWTVTILVTVILLTAIITRDRPLLPCWAGGFLAPLTTSGPVRGPVPVDLSLPREAPLEELCGR